MMCVPERSRETDLPGPIGSVAICSRPLPLARTASRPLTAFRILETAKMIPITTISAMTVRTIPEPLPPADATCDVALVDRCRGVCSPVAPVAACAIWAYERVRAPIRPAPRVNVENRIEEGLRGKSHPLCRPIGPQALGRMPDYCSGEGLRRGRAAGREAEVPDGVQQGARTGLPIRVRGCLPAALSGGGEPARLRPAPCRQPRAGARAGRASRRSPWRRA